MNYITHRFKEINRESARLIARHKKAFPGELCHLQKHSLHAVPVNEIVNKVRIVNSLVNLALSLTDE